MKKLRSLAAALLVAVFVLGALNVSVAGQRDRLRQRVSTLEAVVSNLIQQVGGLRIDSAECADQTAVWVNVSDRPGNPVLVLSC